MRLHRIATALAAAAVLAVTAGCASGPPPAPGTGPTVVTVAHAPSTLFAPLYVADAKGYFAAQGIRVDLQTIKAGQDAVPLAARGQVDVVVAGFSAGLFSAVNAGLDIKVVGSMGISTGDPAASPTALEVGKGLVDSGQVRGPVDLRGRKVAVSGGTGAAGGYQLDVILRGAGLTIKDVDAVNLGFPDMKAAVANGSVAAALSPAPFTTAMEQAGVAVPLGVPPRGTTATGVVYGGKFVRSDAAQRFFTALVRGARDLQGDGATSEANLQILAAATGQDIAVLRKVPSYTWLPDLAPLPDQLQAQQQTYLDAGLFDFPSTVPADRYVDPAFSRAAAVS